MTIEKMLVPGGGGFLLLFLADNAVVVELQVG